MGGRSKQGYYVKENLNVSERGEEVKNQIIRSFCFTLSESQILREIHLIKVMGRLTHKI